MKKQSVSFREWCKANNRLDFLESWDYDKNYPITPDKVSHGTHKRICFSCSQCGTEYERELHHFKASGGNGCPVCSILSRAKARHNTAKEKNNLEFNYPELAEEWDAVKNGIPASEISFNDNKPYWWRCKQCGNEWQAPAYNRIKGTGCPKCASIFHTSFPERVIYFYIKKYFDDAVISDKHLGFELDIFIPSLSIGIEYDGEQWHQDIEKDEIKNRKCEENKITLYRIRERRCWFWKETQYLKLIPTATGDDIELENALKVLLLSLNVMFTDINIKRDKKEILGTYLNAKKQNSLQINYPEIAKEWHPTKNLPLTPERIDYGSGISCFWVCSKCGYEFEATPNSRTCKKSGCPSCNHIIAWTGHTDLKTLYPNLMKEWDYEKNSKIGLDPSKLLPGSEKRAFWKCHKGHKWQAMIANRVRKNYGCPQCSLEKRYKKVLNIETGKVFNSLKDAASFYNLASSKISECCNGKRRTTGGFHWEFIEEES